MPESCSCGAALPPDARFCHKCGKPQREEPAAEALAEQNAPSSFRAGERPVAVAAAPIPLSFHNPAAIRAGLTAASLVSLLMMIPGINYASLLWLLAAGFFSVLLYKRRTGQRLTVRSGARMGWITGVLAFAILTVLFTVGMLVVSRVGGLPALREQLRGLSVQQQDIDRMIEALKSPQGVLSQLCLMFLLMTVTCMAGGALGARVLRKD